MNSRIKEDVEAELAAAGAHLDLGSLKILCGLIDATRSLRDATVATMRDEFVRRVGDTIMLPKAALERLFDGVPPSVEADELAVWSRR